jgi:glycosyltransferase involved in cell wall biosynthesis
MVKISVIIPAYNSQKYLGKTINSVLKQTYQDFVILIGDDGSTDDTLKIIKEFKERYPSKIDYITKDNRGQASITNSLLKRVKTPYVAYLDSDDIWLPEKLERSIDILEKHKSVGVIYSGHYCIDSDDKLTGKYLPPKFNKNILLLSDCINRCTLVHRAEALEKIGNFSEDVTGNDDHDMEIRLSESYDFYEIEPTLLYRIHGDNIHIKRPNKELWALETFHKILIKAYVRRGNPFIIKLITLRVRFMIIMIYIFGLSNNKWISGKLKNFIFKIEMILLNFSDPNSNESS